MSPEHKKVQPNQIQSTLKLLESNWNCSILLKSVSNTIVWYNPVPELRRNILNRTNSQGYKQCLTKSWVSQFDQNLFFWSMLMKLGDKQDDLSFWLWQLITIKRKLWINSFKCKKQWCNISQKPNWCQK